MKTNICRIISVLLCIVLFCAGVPVTAFAEQQEIRNVTISDSGVLTWDPYEGATRYWITLGSSAVAFQPEGTSSDLYKEAMKANLPSGTYSFSLVACDDNWNNLSLTYYGTYIFNPPVGLDEVKGLRWEGRTAKWDAVEGAVGYNVYIYGGGNMILNDYCEETSLDYSKSVWLEAGNDYCFSVMAVAEGDNANGPMSEFSDTIPGWFERKDIQNVKLENGILSWDPYEGADRYWLIMGGAWEPEGTSADLNFLLISGDYGSGVYSIDLVACLDDWTNISKHYTGTFEYVKSDVPLYTVTIVTEGSGTATASTRYGPDGTVVTLTATPDEGHRFKEWVRWEGMLSGGLDVPNADSATTSFTISGYNVKLAAVFEPLPAEESEQVSAEESEDEPPVSSVSESEVSAESEDPFCEGEESGDGTPVSSEGSGGSNTALIIVSVLLALALAAGAVFAFLFYKNKKSGSNGK